MMQDVFNGVLLLLLLILSAFLSTVAAVPGHRCQFCSRQSNLPRYPQLIHVSKQLIC